MLRKLAIAASALVVALVTFTLMGLLGTVTHSDAVGYSDWIEPTKVTDPLPGQLYAISAQGKIAAQLCELNRGDFEISTDALPGRAFVNRLGESVPMVLWAAHTYLQTDLPADSFDIGYRLEWRKLQREFAPLSELTIGVRRILHERDMEQIRRAASPDQIADMVRLEGCASAILQSFEHGEDVCQLTEVIRDDSGNVVAVRFASRCLADPTRGARPLPELEASSFWTTVKLQLGLVDQLLIWPVNGSQATG